MGSVFLTYGAHVACIDLSLVVLWSLVLLIFWCSAVVSLFALLSASLTGAILIRATTASWWFDTVFFTSFTRILLLQFHLFKQRWFLRLLIQVHLIELFADPIAWVYLLVRFINNLIAVKRAMHCIIDKLLFIRNLWALKLSNFVDTASSLTTVELVVEVWAKATSILQEASVERFYFLGHLIA